MNTRTYVATLLLLLAVAGVLRGAWLTADPPVRRSVGIVWHDEGAWVHNARNRALGQAWRTDEWNPVFVAPVFTALEFASFAALGVGTWQARVVPAASGLLAVLTLFVGLSNLAGRRAAVIGGVLLASNYAFVMWNRAALMESTMTMFMVVAWMAWVMADRRPIWATVAGLAAVAAFFTKAAAAFFVAALALDVLVTAWHAWRPREEHRGASRTRVVLACAGLAGGALIVGAFFVLPHWSDYQFYNWQMSVTRKPSYELGAFVDRATWIPVVQGLFSRMPLELLAGLTGLVLLVAGWPAARPGHRLLVLWMLLGLAELVVHDSGNERRYVMFIPALIALAALVLTHAGALAAACRHLSTAQRLATAVVLLPATYIAVGSLLRPWLLDDIETGVLRTAVRMSAVGAVALTAALLWRGRRLAAWSAARTAPPALVVALVAAAVGWNLVQWAEWANTRTHVNHEASIALGRTLPPGTLVQGKLANGLSLENRIRPLFVGNNFGNWADRLQRDDARYILTYDLPRIGYESSDGSGLIQGILDQYPGWRIVASFPVDETRMDDRAVLIDKFPDRGPAHARD